MSKLGSTQLFNVGRHTSRLFSSVQSH